MPLEARIAVDRLDRRRRHDPHLRPVGVELLGDDQRQRGHRPLPHLGRRRHDGDRAVGRDADPWAERLAGALGRQRRGARQPCRSSATAKDSPAAPTITWRRDTWRSKLRSDVLVHGSALPRGALDRAHDALIGSAAADVGAHVLDDLGARRLRLLLEQVGRAHDLAGLAVAALRHLLGEPGLLQRVR